MERLAYVRGPETPPLLECTVGHLLEHAARTWPAADAAVFMEEGVRFDFARLERLSARVASALARIGVGRGDRVAMWAPNCPAWVIVQFAATRLGAILVSINPAYRINELRHALRLSGTRVLILTPQFRRTDYLDMVRALGVDAVDGTPGAVACPDLPDLQALFVVDGSNDSGFASFEVLSASTGDDDAFRQSAAGLAPGDPAAIQFTSGTTGAPKGALLSHFSLVNNASICARAQRLGPTDRLCVPVPLYHCFAQVLASIAGVACGAAVVYPSRAFDAARAYAAIIAEACTAFYGVPTMLLGVLDEREKSGRVARQLRTGIIGGAPCPKLAMEHAISQLGMTDVTICFGMTETSPTTFQTAPEDDVELRTGTVGKVLPHLEARIVRPDGSTAALDEAGEVAVRGHAVMIGYWQNEEATQAVLRDGWMMTGDVGTIDADGYCRISGRIKDIIIRGGENIVPREVEEVLLGHDAIADAHVFGIHDKRLGEDVCAWVKLRDGESLEGAQLREYCRDRLSPFKIPRHIRFVDSFPTTVTGKIQKFVMREAMESGGAH